MEPKPSAHNYTIRASPVPLAFRIVLVQVLIALLSVVAAILLGWFGSYVGGSGPELRTYALISIGLQIPNIFLVVYIVLDWVRTVYVIRPDEVVIQRGALRMDERIYKTEHVESVKVWQSFWGKLFNYGTIEFYSRETKEQVSLLNVPDPQVVCTLMIEKSKGKGEIGSFSLE